MIPFLAGLFGSGGAAAGATGASGAAGAASAAAPAMSTWAKLADFGKNAIGIGGDATMQTASMADNVANGAANSGWGTLLKDLKSGNYASATGNALQMGETAGKSQPPPQSAALPGPVMQPEQPMMQPGPQQMQTSPFLQQMMQRYAR